MAYAIRLPSQELVQVTNKQFIAMWAQQYGASHEDWEISEELVAAFNSSLIIGGLPASARALMTISNTVLSVGEKFLQTVSHQNKKT